MPEHAYRTVDPAYMIAWFDDFDGVNDYRFLSNFYVGDFLRYTHTGPVYQTAEHMFAAAKTLDPDEQYRIRMAATPGKAKALGRTCTLRPDWEVVKLDVMAAILRIKFATHRPEADLLLATGDALLVEGTYWGDRVWGVDLRSPMDNAPGRNWLGTLLMARRAELRAQHAAFEARYEREAVVGRASNPGGSNVRFFEESARALR